MTTLRHGVRQSGICRTINNCDSRRHVARHAKVAAPLISATCDTPLIGVSRVADWWATPFSPSVGGAPSLWQFLSRKEVVS